jgi:alpha-D-xyloside xylohydrolase
LRDQISAGVNLSMSGIPNWTHDIGGFSVEDRYSKQDPAAQDEWRELQVRWFQFGAFSPLFRSHGEFPLREIYNLGKDDPRTYEALAAYDRQRYRLLPYIYTLGADTYFHDGTMMRGLVMDFAADKRVWTIDDEYMIGPAFLVAPVTEYKTRSRKVYLPAGVSWYEWKTGALHPGGQTVEAAAPLADMPLFVRAGSIVPTGPVRQFAADQPDAPVTLLVYPGADGRFSLYEDDGTSQQYLKGAWSRISLAWNEASRTLTIGPREGAFPGMQQRRTFLVRWMRPGRALDWDVAADATVAYDGAAQHVTMPR